jgi:sialate O-acetylesterase
MQICKTPSTGFACAAALIALTGLPLSAAVTLPAVITDHMVVQRNLPVHIWGWAAPGEAITVTFRGANGATSADSLGQWNVYLPPGDAGGPFPMNIKGDNTIEFSDVLVGDVWVASGQSNMEFSLVEAINGPAEIAAANHPQIRLFQVEHAVSAYPLDDVKAQPWAACTPETAATFSAVAYFFARQLEEREHVPIGLIETNWGGTPAEAWTSMRGLGADASLIPVFLSWSSLADEFSAKTRRLELARQAQEKAKAEGRKPGDLPWEPNERLSWSPAGLFNAMIAPLTPYPIRGSIWYQGESNTSADRAPIYRLLFQTMIRDWRRAWGEGDFPFLFVQIANFKASSAWPEVREAQRKTLDLVNTGMAVTIDIGDAHNIHPKNKQDVGLRLALAAEAISYGEKVEYSGPLFRQATRSGDSLNVWFDHVQSGLVAKGGVLTGFEIASSDGKFVPADAVIEGDHVSVSSPAVKDPAVVRYAWSSTPDASLFNGAGLPASPFQSTDGKSQ